MADDTHQLTEQHACGRTERKRDQAEGNNLKRIRIQESFCACSRSHGGSQQNNNGIHQRVGSRIGQLSHNAGFSEQVAQHQHTDQRSRSRKNQGYNNRYDDGEQNLFQLGNRTKLFHFNLPLLFRGKQPHDRGLDNRNQRHIGISRYGNRSKKLRLSQLSAQEDGSRAVRSADDGDGSCRSVIEAQSDRAKISGEDTKLRCCSQQEALRVRNQGTKVRHRADAHEYQRRQNRPFIQHIEVIEQAARTVCRLLRAKHDIRINIYQQHTEGDRKQKQGFKAPGNRQIKKNAGDYDHQIVSPGQVKERCLMNQIVQSSYNIIHLC